MIRIPTAVVGNVLKQNLFSIKLQAEFTSMNTYLFGTRPCCLFSWPFAWLEVVSLCLMRTWYGGNGLQCMFYCCQKPLLREANHIMIKWKYGEALEDNVANLWTHKLKSSCPKRNNTSDTTMKEHPSVPQGQEQEVLVNLSISEYKTSLQQRTPMVLMFNNWECHASWCWIGWCTMLSIFTACTNSLLSTQVAQKWLR